MGKQLDPEELLCALKSKFGEDSVAYVEYSEAMEAFTDATDGAAAHLSEAFYGLITYACSFEDGGVYVGFVGTQPNAEMQKFFEPFDAEGSLY